MTVALHLADVTVRHCGAAGIRLQTSSPGVGPLSLYMERCLVEGNGGEGVYVRSHNVRLDITDSNINTNTRQQVYVVSNAGSVSIASSRLVAERGRYYNLYDMAQINSRYGLPVRCAVRQVVVINKKLLRPQHTRTYIYAHVHIYIHTYIHTYIHMYILV